MTTKDRWTQLLASHRLHDPPSHHSPLQSRTPFDADYGRVVFSSQFRRLQDKTQVFPLAKSDYTRTRLTHTMEVASVGQGLGKYLGKQLAEANLLPEHYDPGDLGIIVAVACLAHDLGNPPFGHSGEAAIQEWAKRRQKVLTAKGKLSKKQFVDIEQFEGNAQSFRIMARLWDRTRYGGAKLTLASYGALLKYPQHSSSKIDKADCARKKFNFFQADIGHAQAVQEGLGLQAFKGGMFRRHPLVYLMEAADDVCNSVIDIEDAGDEGTISREKMVELLQPLLSGKLAGPTKKELLDKDVSELRANAISTLLAGVQKAITDNLEDLTEGKEKRDLMAIVRAENAALDQALNAISKCAQDDIYTDERILKIESAGFKIIGGLLDEFYGAMGLEGQLTKSNKKLLRIFPKKYLAKDATYKDETHEALLDLLSPYERVLAMTDFVSGMTDSYALELHQTLTGVRIP